MGLFDPLPDHRGPADFRHYRGYPTNPYLSYRPNFARSLPIQILVTGITLTLVSVLLIQLIFTAQYHARLAKVNFILQMSAAITLLASVIASLTFVLNEAIRESQDWPFMLNYVAVDLPPFNDPRNGDGWSRTGLAAWLLMNATVSALTQITHIQFLALMYPSRLEAQLIFILLGPLAIVAATMQLAPLHSSTSLASGASAVRNVCNATLSILFTLSLAVWGLAVNRKQAWRTDGGTAAFGIGALLLALASTALTIAYIPSRDQFEWVPMLTGAVVLWQSFLGWWWWVGAGMGVGEVEEWLRRAEKRRRRRSAREQRRREQKEKLREAWHAISGRGSGDKRQPAANDAPRAPRRSSDNDSVPASSETITSSTTGSSKPSDAGGGIGAWSLWPWSLGRAAYRLVRNAHVSAARRRAVERAEHIREVFGVEGSGHPADAPANSGWGLGAFGVRERQREAAEAALEMESFEGLVQRNRGDGSGGDADGGGGEMEGNDEGRRGNRDDGHDRQRKPSPPRPQARALSMWWWGPLRRWRLQDTTEY
ncbi:hypothetical protein BC834DRAFT_831412 [Gloeopeniophorella convolvens]|nr:hypothetical protein BC834DRAFT_831412 [Gloeopeniophorella convolvens]